MPKWLADIGLAINRMYYHQLLVSQYYKKPQPPAWFEHLDYTDRVVIDGRRVARAREARIYEGVCW